MCYDKEFSYKSGRREILSKSYACKQHSGLKQDGSSYTKTTT